MAFQAFLQNSGIGGIVNWLVYAAILLVFLFGLLKCVVPVLRNRSLLRRAIRNVRAGDKTKQSWQSEEFLGKGALYTHWNDYLDSLFFADGVYHNASDVADYINEETVIYGPGRGSFADAVPGLLVSVGFLGTLIGLAQGLSGFDMSDSSAVMASIVTLIPGMRFAFMTSIVGVVGSVCFTLITRFVYGSTERTLRNFYGALGRYAKLSAVDPMTQVAIYQQEQTVLLRQMTEELSDNITEAVSRAVEPLNNSLRSFVSVTTKDQMRFLDAVVTRFIERMDSLLGGQVTRLSQALEEAAQRQEHILGAVQDDMEGSSAMLQSIRQVCGIAEDMVRDCAGYIQDLRGKQQQTDEAFRLVTSGMEQTELLSREQANCLKSVSAMQTEITGALEKMNLALRDFVDEVSMQSDDAGKSLRDAAGELRATGEELRRIHRDCASGITEELKLTMDAYQDYVNQFTQRVDYLSNGITEAVRRLPEAVDESANLFLDQVDRLSDALKQAQRALNDTVDRLRGEPRSRR